MSDPSSNSSSKYCPFFNKKEASIETNTKLDFISSIWDDDHIEIIDEISGIVSGAIIHFSELILPRLWLMYREKWVWK